MRPLVCAPAVSSLRLALYAQCPSQNVGGAAHDAGGSAETPLSKLMEKAPVPKGELTPMKPASAHADSSAKPTDVPLLGVAKTPTRVDGVSW